MGEIVDKDIEQEWGEDASLENSMPAMYFVFVLLLIDCEEGRALIHHQRKDHASSMVGASSLLEN
jgi:hypothetical protein